MRKDKYRIIRQELKKLMPKRVRAASGVSKYGKITGDTPSTGNVLIIPVNGRYYMVGQ